MYTHRISKHWNCTDLNKYSFSKQVGSPSPTQHFVKYLSSSKMKDSKLKNKRRQMFLTLRTHCSVHQIKSVIVLYRWTDPRGRKDYSFSTSTFLLMINDTESTENLMLAIIITVVFINIRGPHRPPIAPPSLPCASYQFSLLSLNSNTRHLSAGTG